MEGFNNLAKCFGADRLLSGIIIPSLGCIPDGLWTWWVLYQYLFSAGFILTYSNLLPKLVDISYSYGITCIHVVDYAATRFLHLYSPSLKISFLVCSVPSLIGHGLSSLDCLALSSLGYLHVINP